MSKSHQVGMRLPEINRELQRVALIRYVSRGIKSSAVNKPEVDDDGLTEDAQELLSEFFTWHPKIKRRWQEGLSGSDTYCSRPCIDSTLMTAAINALRGVAGMIRQGQR